MRAVAMAYRITCEIKVFVLCAALLKTATASMEKDWSAAMVTYDRLCRDLKNPDIGKVVSGCVAEASGQQDTFLIIDLMDVHKLYAKKMPFLGKVGSNLGYNSDSCILRIILQAPESGHKPNSVST